MFPSEEKYVNEIEESLYNIAIASQDGEKGIRYFSWIHMYKQEGGLVHCCCGVGTRLFGMLPEFIYSVSDETLYLDIYAASSIDWESAKGMVHVDMKTNMPYDGKVSITVDPESKQEFSVFARIPVWVKEDVKVLVNGEVHCVATSGNYAEIRRVWEKGDVIEFELSFAFSITRYVGAEEVDNADRYAYMYGPLLMAFKGELDAYNHIRIPHDPYRYESWLIPDGTPLSFDVVDMDDLKFVPYYSLESGEPFTCYPVFNTLPDHFPNKGRATSRSW
jgi:DUF1680 family protein